MIMERLITKLMMKLATNIYVYLFKQLMVS